MKNRRFGVILAATFASVLAEAAETESLTARDLYNLCRKPPSSAEGGMCRGYIGGVVEMMMRVHNQLLPAPPDPDLLAVQLTCFGRIDVNLAREAFLAKMERIR